MVAAGDLVGDLGEVVGQVAVAEADLAHVPAVLFRGVEAMALQGRHQRPKARAPTVSRTSSTGMSPSEAEQGVDVDVPAVAVAALGAVRVVADPEAVGDLDDLGPAEQPAEQLLVGLPLRAFGDGLPSVGAGVPAATTGSDLGFFHGVGLGLRSSTSQPWASASSRSAWASPSSSRRSRSRFLEAGQPVGVLLAQPTGLVALAALL